MDSVAGSSLSRFPRTWLPDFVAAIQEHLAERLDRLIAAQEGLVERAA